LELKLSSGFFVGSWSIGLQESKQHWFETFSGAHLKLEPNRDSIPRPVHAPCYAILLIGFSKPILPP
jgi:hypothetical protein